MRGLLDDRSRATKTVKAKRNSAAAVCVMLLLFGSCIFAVVYLQAHLTTHPLLKLIPFLTMVLGMAAVTPLGMYLAHQDEFQDLNPLSLDHYLLLTRKTLTSITQNNWKVDSKQI
ncbi:hypothetical protein WJX74_003487 [Apatococcus lobatus]|uniref:Uncharacterized protein n=2 Tax=Apatococcus TaxID=904362 RepID=A0AAW1SX59_9CHLO